MNPRSNRKPALGQRSTSKKHTTLMSSNPEPAIWSRDTGQRIFLCDSCQLNIIWMSNIKDICFKAGVNMKAVFWLGILIMVFNAKYLVFIFFQEGTVTNPAIWLVLSAVRISDHGHGNGGKQRGWNCHIHFREWTSGRSFPFLHFHGRLINASLPLFTSKSQGSSL